MPCACNIVAHDECVPELAGVLGVDCDAQKWTVQGADDWELVFPACSEEQEAELAADGDCVVCGDLLLHVENSNNNKKSEMMQVVHSSGQLEADSNPVELIYSYMTYSQ